MIEAAGRSGSARGLIATYSSLGFLKLRLGALPEADTAMRVTLRVLREGDFTAGMGVAAIAAEVAVEAGKLEEAQELLEPDSAGTSRGRQRAGPGREWPPGSGARGRRAGTELFRVVPGHVRP